MSAKEIVAKLRAMAADPSHRAQLVREAQTIPTLIFSLADPDTDIAFTSLEVVYFLSLNVDNRPIMAQEVVLLKSLKQFMMTGTLKQKKVAIAAYTNLQAYANSLPTNLEAAGAEKENANNSDVVTSNSTSSSSSSACEAKSATAPVPTLLHAPLAGGKSVVTEGTTVNTYTVFISGLNSDSAKKEIEQTLLRIKGVISIYCDPLEYKAVVRATIPVQEVIEKLTSEGKSASLRKKDVVKESENENDGYLEEVDTTAQSKDPNAGSSWFGFGGLVTFGSETPDERKARLEKERKQQSGGWFGKLGKALYIM